MKSNREHKTIKIFEVIGNDSGIISSISVQKKNSNRFSVFVGDAFIIGVSDSCLVHFNLKKGSLIDQKVLDKIQEFEEKWSVKNHLLRLLGRRDHASFELKQKAIKKGFSITLIEQTISELEEKGYINNAVFARKFAHDKFKFNKWGPQKIRLELKKKGLRDSDITLAIKEIQTEDSVSTMNHLFQKSKPRFLRASKEKRRKKIFDFFIRKGYDSELIQAELPNWLSDLES